MNNPFKGAGSIFNIFGRSIKSPGPSHWFRDVIALRNDWALIGSEIKKLIWYGKQHG